MKLIHLPTGEIYEEKIQPYKLLNKYPDNYIRAELPEYWRVEGYDKSLEWAKYQPAYDPSEHPWDFVTNKKGRNVFDKECSDVTFMQLTQISRAEFEYHVYNLWREGQAPKPTLAEIILQAKTLYGVDLVTKPAEETEIVFEIRQHKIAVNSDTLLIRDMMDREAVLITREDFDMIAARSKEIPANYEQERKN